jgi:predicted RNA-binding Zn ribbon-like protein
MRIIARSFSPRDLVAGHMALDLINTVTARNSPEPIDWLDSYDRLVEWSRLARVADATTLAALDRMASVHTRQALARIKVFREALYCVCHALFRVEAVPKAALDQVESMWKQTLERAKLVPVRKQVGISIEPARGLDLILDEVAMKAIEFLRHLPSDRARICPGERCGWLFVDSSKGGQRVWCDMATCGNVAKSRRHQAALRRGRRRTRPSAETRGKKPAPE